MRVVDIVIGVGWVIFWVGWFAASAGAKRGQRGRGNWARFAGVRVVLILVVVLLVRLRVLKGHGVGYVRDPVLWGVGLAIWVLGLGLAVWARIYLGRNWGMPTSTKEDPELVTSGPYRTIRHPIYTGILLVIIGADVDQHRLMPCIAQKLSPAMCRRGGLVRDRLAVQLPRAAGLRRVREVLQRHAEGRLPQRGPDLSWNFHIGSLKHIEVAFSGGLTTAPDWYFKKAGIQQDTIRIAMVLNKPKTTTKVMTEVQAGWHYDPGILKKRRVGSETKNLTIYGA